MTAPRFTPDDIIKRFALVPLTREGGYFRETYRSSLIIPPSHLPNAYAAPRAAATAIYYLITPDNFSALHRLRSDEVYHFYYGDPVDLLQLYPDGSGHVTKLGSDLATGLVPQAVVPGGVWQGAGLRIGGSVALLGTTMSPGFDEDDFELGERDRLLAQYPPFASEIMALTRPKPIH